MPAIWKTFIFCKTLPSPCFIYYQTITLYNKNSIQHNVSLAFTGVISGILKDKNYAKLKSISFSVKHCHKELWNFLQPPKYMTYPKGARYISLCRLKIIYLQYRNLKNTFKMRWCLCFPYDSFKIKDTSLRSMANS